MASPLSLAREQRRDIKAEMRSTRDAVLERYAEFMDWLERRTGATVEDFYEQTSDQQVSLVSAWAGFEAGRQLLQEARDRIGSLRLSLPGQLSSSQRRMLLMAENHTRQQAVTQEMQQLPSLDDRQSLQQRFRQQSKLLPVLFEYEDQTIPDMERTLASMVVVRMAAPAVVQATRNLIFPEIYSVSRVFSTEPMRAYRVTVEELMTGYTPDGGVKGWIWWSEMALTTCAACWLMHGKRFQISTSLDGHPSCRCTAIPVFDPSKIPGYQTGEELMEQMDAARLTRILGPKKYGMYQRGEASLSDFVGQRTDPVYGRVIYERSAKSVAAGGSP